jgi:hypothetical protein
VNECEAKEQTEFRQDELVDFECRGEVGARQIAGDQSQVRAGGNVLLCKNRRRREEGRMRTSGSR